MTATDELRKLLDDRGVDWRKWSGNSKRKTQWFMPNSNIGSNAPGSYCVTVEEHKDGSLFFKSMIASPEQVIAATLGHSLNNPSMSETLSERGACRNVSDPPEGFLCSECGWGDFAEPSHLLTGSCYAGLAKGPRYCPNCGKKVEG